MTDKLNCYASGNGALHFCWLTQVWGAGRLPDLVASGQPVTLDEAKAYLDSPEGESLKAKGFRACVLDGVHPVLIADVRRIDDNTLSVEGKQYTYEINKDDFFFKRDGHVREASLTLYATDDGERFKVRNINAISAVCHYLSNEKAINEAFPDTRPVAYSDAGEGI